MSQLKKRERICPSFAFLFYLGPQQIGRCLPRQPSLRKTDLFTQSADSHADLFQKHPDRHTQKYCFASYLGFPSPNQVDTKISHHRLGVFLTRKIKVLMEREGIQICEGCHRGKGVRFLLVLTEGRMRIIE